MIATEGFLGGKELQNTRSAGSAPENTSNHGGQARTKGSAARPPQLATKCPHQTETHSQPVPSAGPHLRTPEVAL